MSDLSHLRDLAISESGFVFDPQSGSTFTLNPTGLAVLLALRDGATREDLRARLGEKFDEVAASVDEDLADFFHTLRQLGLLVDAPAKGATS